LAFLIPVLEKLHRAQWTELDGLGALILSPTRELAVQTFEVLRKVGRHHPFSAGMIIGGRDMQEEAERIGKMDILVCTPGRFLEHLDRGAISIVDNLQILVLDEADRIMDSGFQRDVDAMIGHLPTTRQTLLFSATQTKKVSDLARLSLRDPEYISVHEAADAATPATLQQHYVVTPLPDKLNTLWGFLRSNLKRKIVVFFASCKQVRFAYESFRRLQPGISLMHLHGRQKQYARLGITRGFTTAKHACLFATDVVARGVDFPAVDWVVQVDCPEDAETYIHRVGRTARYNSEGRALLLLEPSEEAGMVKRLGQKKIPIARIQVREKKKENIQDQLQNLCFKDQEVNRLALTAFTNYVRSVQWQKDKDIFNLDKLDLQEFARSMGLAGAPAISFQKGEDRKTLKNQPRADLDLDSEEDGSEGGAQPRKKDPVKTKVQKMLERTNQDVLSSHYRDMFAEDDEEEGGEGENAEFFSRKRVLRGSELAEAAGGEDALPPPAKTVQLGNGAELIVDSRRREKMLQSKKKLLKFRGSAQKLVFDAEGNAHELYELRKEEDFHGQGPAEVLRQRFVDEQAQAAREADLEDKAVAKRKRLEKRAKRKARERGNDAGAFDVRLDVPEGDEDGDRGLALLRSLPLPGEGSSDDEQEAARPRKKRHDGRRKVAVDSGDEPQTVEDLEALAVGLLDG